MNAIKTQTKQFNNYFKDNVIPLSSAVLSSGTATFTQELTDYLTTQSIKVNLGNFNTTSISFNFGKTFETTITKTQNHYISFAVKSYNEFVLRMKVYINGIATDLDCDVKNSNDWQTFSQILDLRTNDVVNITFTAISNVTASNSFAILLDAFCFSDGFINFAYPNNETGFESKSDTLNTISLTGATENTMVLTGTSVKNGGLNLLDANSKIVPIGLNDVITIDFACTFVTPTGTNNYVDVKLLVDGIIYRAITHQFLKTSGVNDYFSVSWTLSVQDFLLLNGAIISIKPNVTTNYKERFIQVTRTHKGK